MVTCVVNDRTWTELVTHTAAASSYNDDGSNLTKDERLVSDTFGYLASVGTSLLFSLSSIAFTAAGRKVSSPVVNRVRLVLAFGFVAALHTLAFGMPLPFDAAPERFLFLGLSGIIGFVLGDAFLFQAYVMIGPRLALLVMSLAPILTVLLAFAFLHERLLPVDLLGIAITLAGVVLVVSERRGPQDTIFARPGSRAYLVGLGCALGGAVGQAVGLIFSKQGLVGAFPPLSGNVIRLGSAMVVIWVITLATGRAGETVRHLRAHPGTMRLLVMGALLGPVSAVSLALFSLQLIPAGVASTLQSLMPVFMIPIAFVFYRERPTRTGVLGTILALVGISILFLW
jgi:drug/metabolite transporter (DMT)-like permease